MPRDPISSSHWTSVTSRRQILKILAVGGTAGAAWQLGGCSGGKGPMATRSAEMMGTTIHLTVVANDPEAAGAAADTALREMAKVEALLSRDRADSDVSRLNATGRIENASPVLIEALKLATLTSRLGHGAFDITVEPILELYRRHQREDGTLPSPAAVEEARELVAYQGVQVMDRTVALALPGAAITLDGMAKGCVVDRGVAVLRLHGYANVFLDAGGDLMAGGHEKLGEPWSVDIQRPRPGRGLQARFGASERAVATSCDCRHAFSSDFTHHQIIDPDTGYSPSELASATVTAKNVSQADAFATMAMVLGPKQGLELFEDLEDCEAYLVSKDLEVTKTSGFEVA